MPLSKAEIVATVDTEAAPQRHSATASLRQRSTGTASLRQRGDGGTRSTWISGARTLK